ncbi:MAG: CHRD domain-containing protein [Gemmatimonadota bacterium]|nr:CHRD domain-containing protein [Gemmatimonadota bacterium]MDH3368645.1 CHRD domain-containing protein [Gemmatimonadota bacterium]MDH3478139.1 CHRD domain-containing protein [Gemmatimonadota bacterium]MDH5550116.1 CHRD domain-containing protein [Gemmatimonadota bacterium]
MRTSCRVALGAFASALLIGCAEHDTAAPALDTEAVFAHRADPAAAMGEPAAQRNFVAVLSSADAGTDSKGRGVAMFQLSHDGTMLRYRLNVANIENVLMAHIHIAPAGANGPVAVWLYPSGPPPQLLPGRFQGVLATGTITDANLVGPLAGMTLADLVTMLDGNMAYVNVHTHQHPGGEIRGQISVPHGR